MAKKTRAPIFLMYSALMSIGAVSNEIFTDREAIERVRIITNTTLREMNSVHTKVVQKAVFEIKD